MLAAKDTPDVKAEATHRLAEIAPQSLQKKGAPCGDGKGR
jgi:hypothetical protein